jgi:hypothetical protein
MTAQVACVPRIGNLSSNFVSHCSPLRRPSGFHLTIVSRCPA